MRRRDGVKTLYKWWAALLLVAVILQIGFAGYGAFYVAEKLDGEGNSINDKGFEDGFGIHMGFGYLVWLLGIIFLAIGVIAGIGRWRLGRHGLLALLLTLQVLLAWFGSEVPAIGFFHPVNAMVIVIVLVWTVLDLWRGKAVVPVAASPPASA
jgi:hypothetical protein